jgi:hypothetical protein
MAVRADAVADIELRYGYTLADVDKLSLTAVLALRQGSGGFQERRELARWAIAECLYASGEAPSRYELVDAARRAIAEQFRAECIAHGVDRQRGYAAKPNFWRYWYPACPAQGPEEQVVDRVALAQIWAGLSPLHQDVLLALAAYDDHDQAARSLGISRAAYTSRLSKARRAFYQLWHEGEQPSQLWARDHRGGKEGRSNSRTPGIIRRRERDRRMQNAARKTQDSGDRHSPEHEAAG